MDGHVGAAAKGEALAVGGAGGFEHKVQPQRKEAQGSQRGLDGEAAVGVDEEELLGPGVGEAGGDARGVRGGAVGGEFDPVPLAAALAVVGDTGAHVGGGAGVYGGDDG